jgi:hypothetical protein
VCMLTAMPLKHGMLAVKATVGLDVKTKN